MLEGRLHLKKTQIDLVFYSVCTIFAADMEQLSLGTMQFTAVVLMALVTFKLMVPHRRSQLTAWVKQRGYESFSRWMTALRIDEAKRMLQEHPDWGTEAVADYCSFSSREYFHRIFREHEGMTPAQYQKQRI